MIKLRVYWKKLPDKNSPSRKRVRTEANTPYGSDGRNCRMTLDEPCKPYGRHFLECCSTPLSTYQTCMKHTGKASKFYQLFCRQYRQRATGYRTPPHLRYMMLLGRSFPHSAPPASADPDRLRSAVCFIFQCNCICILLYLRISQRLWACRGDLLQEE